MDRTITIRRVTEGAPDAAGTPPKTWAGFDDWFNSVSRVMGASNVNSS
jgi:hypothetical protein